MAKNAGKAPDAWDDDDWEAQADRAVAEEAPKTEGQVPLTKKERRAQHAELNRKLWESADAQPETPFHVAASGAPPLATGFKPAVKVLSRRPAPQMIAKRDPVTGMASMTLDDESDEEEKKVQLSREEILAKQQREREEKQRRYEEVRAKIFGESPGPSSGASSPGTVTPPGRNNDSRGPRGRGRGRGRGGNGGGGGGGGGQGGQGGGASLRDDNRGDRETQRPTRQPATGERELYDPNYSSRPGFPMEKRSNNGSGRSTPREDDQVIRTPRGPDGSGRGGFGFARRGGRES